MLLKRVLENYQSVLPQPLGALRQQLEQLLTGNVSLGMLTDIIAATAELPARAKLELLKEHDVDRRAELLLTALQSSRGNYPPNFSVN